MHCSERPLRPTLCALVQTAVGTSWGPVPLPPNKARTLAGSTFSSPTHRHTPIWRFPCWTGFCFNQFDSFFSVGRGLSCADGAGARNSKAAMPELPVESPKGTGDMNRGNTTKRPRLSSALLWRCRGNGGRSHARTLNFLGWAMTLVNMCQPCLLNLHLLFPLYKGLGGGGVWLWLRPILPNPVVMAGSEWATRQRYPESSSSSSFEAGNSLLTDSLRTRWVANKPTFFLPNGFVLQTKRQRCDIQKTDLRVSQEKPKTPVSAVQKRQEPFWEPPKFAARCHGTQVPRHRVLTGSWPGRPWQPEAWGAETEARDQTQLTWYKCLPTQKVQVPPEDGFWGIKMGLSTFLEGTWTLWATSTTKTNMNRRPEIRIP